MMKTTHILMEEHQVILKNLNELESLLISEEFEDKIAKLKYYFDFIKDYSDDFHHAKEESIYFMWMLEKNPTLKSGPIKCMLSDHNVFRNLVNSAYNSFMAYQNEGKKEEDKMTCIRNLRQFINQLRYHIDKEDTILYRMAESLNLDHQDGDSEMLPAFKKVNDEHEDLVRKFTSC